MATTTNGNPLIMRKNLLMAEKAYLETGARQKPSRKLARVRVTSDQLFEIMALQSGIGLPSVRTEFQTAPQSEMTQVASKQWTPEKRLLQLRMSDEAFINDQYGIVKPAGQTLRFVYDVAEEISAAKYMNGAASTGIIATPQGIALASTAHPLEAGTDASEFATAQALGITALEQAVQNLMLQKAYKGFVSPAMGPFQLEVAPQNAMLGQRLIADQSKLPQSNDNDPNPVAGLVTELVVDPWFSNPGWWAICSTNRMEHRRVRIERYGFKLSEVEYDQDNDSWKVTARESYLYDVSDYRGVYYSRAA